MTRHARLWLVACSAATLFTALAGLGAYLAFRWNRATQPPPPRVQVPSRFQDIRESPGHLAHVHDAGLACASCHALAMGLTFDVPDADLCSRCHDERATVHASILAQAATDCLSCHTFAEDRNIRPTNCGRCHASGQGFVGAIVQHGREDCMACHRPHAEPSLAPRPCEECHATERAKHANGVKGALLCLDCHRSHDTSIAADARCADCHGRGQAAVPASATFAGHPKCVTCHVPHDFSRAGVIACRTCHDQPILAASKVPRHRDCAACHDRHDLRGQKTSRSCATCHAAIKNGHGKTPGASTDSCLSCHPAHPAAPMRGSALACATCHTRAASDTAFHAGNITCTQCHAPHAFGVSGARRQDLCASCHEEKQRSVRRMASKGHVDCMGCHRSAAHEPAVAPTACALCHTQVQASAPRGHDTCANCHDSHSGAILASATCAACHEEEARTAHARVREGCQTCHRPHGPGGPASPPSCATCHAPARLRSLHRQPGHGRCSDCHTAHEQRPRGDRASCSRCHQGLETHEPTTNQCTGCHLFR